VTWLNAAVREIVSLFIDDGAFALAIVIWLGLVGLLAWRVDAARAWAGVALFAGLAVILGESALRRARK
jgi:hypothetical protein